MILSDSVEWNSRYELLWATQRVVASETNSDVLNINQATWRHFPCICIPEPQRGFKDKGGTNNVLAETNHCYWNYTSTHYKYIELEFLIKCHTSDSCRPTSSSAAAECCGEIFKFMAAPAEQVDNEPCYKSNSHPQDLTKTWKRKTTWKVHSTVGDKSETSRV